MMSGGEASGRGRVGQYSVMADGDKAVRPARLDARLINVLLLGLGFMFVFTAFQTMGNIEQTVLDSMHKDDPSFTADGYTSLAIIYSVFAICNWIAPSIISFTSPKVAMVLGSIIYTAFILLFLVGESWLLYLMSAVIGLGAAVIWTGQGNYLVLNSDSDTIQRNSSIFWAMLQCSMFFGNIFVYFQFEGEKDISADTRTVVFIVLGVLAAIGIGFFLILRPARSQSGDVVANAQSSPLQALKDSLKLFATRDMILLTLTFFYTGLELSFFSGVYGPSLGFTKQFGDKAKQLVGLSGIFVGIGEVLGGLLFSILGARTLRWGRDPVVIGGYILHILGFFLIFINLPNRAPLQETDDSSYISANAYLAMLCSFLLGFGDSCYNTQIYSMIGSMWKDNSAAAMAIFKFVQSVGAAASFFYSSAATLQVHLGILIGLGTLGTVTFCVVEWADKRRRRKQTPDVSEATTDP